MNGLRVLAATVLAKTARWVGARLEQRDGRDTKIPYAAVDPSRKASSTDPSTWTTFNVARRAVEIGWFPLIGFVLGDGYVGIDLDKCRNPETGAIAEWATEIITLLDSYTEISVSGTGIHILCLGALPPGGRRKASIEMYDAARFFVLTGDVIRGTEIVDRTDRLAQLHGIVFGQAEPAGRFDLDDTRGTEGIGDDDVYGPLTDDQVLLRAAAASNGEKFLALWRGDLSAYSGDHSSADLALVAILMFWTRGDRAQADRLFRQSDLVRDKWTKRSDYRDRTFNKAVTP